MSWNTETLRAHTGAIKLADCGVQLLPVGHTVNPHKGTPLVHKASGLLDFLLKKLSNIFSGTLHLRCYSFAFFYDVIDKYVTFIFVFTNPISTLPCVLFRSDLALCILYKCSAIYCRVFLLSADATEKRV